MKSWPSIVWTFVTAVCVLALCSCGQSDSGSGDVGVNGSSADTRLQVSGNSVTGSTDPLPTQTYSALVDPNTRRCPPVDVEYASRAPQRWRVCSTPDGGAGALINISDDVEVFSAPSDLTTTAIHYDPTPQGNVLLA